MTPYIGTPTSRVDGRAKVTGAAKYAGRVQRRPASPMASVVVVDASPRAASRASTRARRCASTACIDVLTHENRPRMAEHRQRLQGRCRAGAARRSGRSTTTRSCSAASRSRWCWPRTGRPRASRPRWCASSTTRRRTPPTCTRSATRPFAGRRQLRTEAARRRRQGLCGGRRAPRGRILHPDRASQPDGAVCLDRDLGRRRQAHGLRQDPGRAERAALSRAACST